MGNSLYTPYTTWRLSFLDSEGLSSLSISCQIDYCGWSLFCHVRRPLDWTHEWSPARNFPNQWRSVRCEVESMLCAPTTLQYISAAVCPSLHSCKTRKLNYFNKLDRHRCNMSMTSAGTLHIAWKLPVGVVLYRHDLRFYQFCTIGGRECWM